MQGGQQSTLRVCLYSNLYEMGFEPRLVAFRWKLSVCVYGREQYSTTADLYFIFLVKTVSMCVWLSALSKTTLDRRCFLYANACLRLVLQVFSVPSLIKIIACYKCHSKSLKQYQCNWCHKMLINADWMSNVQMFQWSNIQMFQCSNVPMCFSFHRVARFSCPLVH